MAYVVITYIVMAYMVMALYSDGPYTYGPVEPLPHIVMARLVVLGARVQCVGMPRLEPVEAHQPQRHRTPRRRRTFTGP